LADQSDISIIIPARNEAAYLPRTLQCVMPDEPGDVIVVDGGSEDGTVEIARRWDATVLGVDEPGRGRQMNLGASHAKGEVLLFLHADTLLPAGYTELIEQALASSDITAGAFALAIEAEGRGYRFIERTVRWRSRWGQLPYGDQALFMPRAMFEAVGGFPDEPIMEDFELMRRLRKRGRVALIRSPVHTAPRQWRRHGLMRTTVTNISSALAYAGGVSPRHITRWRRWLLSRGVAEPSRAAPWDARPTAEATSSPR